MAQRIEYLYVDPKEYDPAAAKKHLTFDAAPKLRALHDAFAKLETWQPETINAAIAEVMQTQSVKLGALAQPLRVALSGTPATPPIDITLRLVGKPENPRKNKKSNKMDNQITDETNRTVAGGIVDWMIRRFIFLGCLVVAGSVATMRCG